MGSMEVFISICAHSSVQRHIKASFIMGYHHNQNAYAIECKLVNDGKDTYRFTV